MTALAALLAMSACASVEPPVDPESRVVLESKPSAFLIQEIERSFASASGILIRYTPPEAMGRIGYTMEMAARDWRYSFEFRCGTLCYEKAPELRRRLLSGRRIEGNCPGPFSTVIALQSRDVVFATIYVHGSGGCFTLADASYAVGDGLSFDDLFRRESKLTW